MFDESQFKELMNELALTRSAIDNQTKLLSSFMEYLTEKMDTAPFLNNFSPHTYLSFQALKESCELIAPHMDKAMVFRTNKPGDQHSVLIHALEQSLIDGLILEFGVYEGNSINIISEKLQDRKVYGFDSFEGLPTEWSGRHVKQGHFKKISLPKVNDNVILVKGWFDDTVPEFASENKDKAISFLHIDCDLYSSTKTVFDNLKGNIRAGTIIVFDDYMNYTTWKNHEHRAFMEFCESENVNFQWLAFGLQQASVLIKSIRN